MTSKNNRLQSRTDDDDPFQILGAETRNDRLRTESDREERIDLVFEKVDNAWRETSDVLHYALKVAILNCICYSIQNCSDWIILSVLVCIVNLKLLVEC